jgi:polyribonucleotide 5'-hydroxyl-kinase
MVVGPTDSGKSTLCRVLCAYACRVGRCPTFVDVDIGQGEISIPGTLAATPLDRASLSVEEGYGNATPLAYFYGSVTPSEAVEPYRNYLTRLGDTVTRRLAHDEAARVGGLLVNTMGWVDGGGYDLLLDTVRAFAIDVIVVMGHDRVFARLADDVKAIKFPVPPALAGAAAAGGAAGGAGASASAASASSSSSATAEAPAASILGHSITVLKLARPGGVVERGREARRDARKARIREYFYGPARAVGLPPALSPASTTLSFDDVTIVRVGGAASEAALLPVGKASALDPLRVTPVAPSPALLHAVLGVSFAAVDKQVPHVNVAGFVHVSAVNAEARTLTLLLPCAGALPTRYLVMGSLTWVE